MPNTITITAPDWPTFWSALERELHAERIAVAAWPRPILPACALCGTRADDLVDGRCQDCLHDDELGECLDAIEWIDALQAFLDDLAIDEQRAALAS